MAKIRPSDVFFWILATVALALFVFFVLVLSGTIGAEPSRGSTDTASKAEQARTTSPQPTQPFKPPKAQQKPRRQTSTKTTATVTPPPPKPAQLVTVVLTASRGDCWFQARAGSANGPVLDERVLSRGESISLRSKSVWLAVGAAGNLDVTVDGKPRQLSSGTISVVLGAKTSDRG
jgi:uncharacterized protein DUF4115